MTKKLWGTVHRSLRERGAADMANSQVVTPLIRPIPTLTPEEADAVLKWVHVAVKEYGGGRPGSHLHKALGKLRMIADGKQ